MNNQKQIEELEATIQKAQQQIEELKKPKWAESIKDVKGRNWFIDENGEIDYTGNTFLDKNNFSNSERAKAFLALGQLRELHADMGIEKDADAITMALVSKDDNMDIEFWFETEEQCDYFKSQHAELIRIVEEGI